MDLEWFKRKEFGLPIWAWGLITAVVVILAYRYFKSKNPASGTGASGLYDANASDAGGAAAGSLIPTPLGNVGAVAPSASGTDPLPIYDIPTDTSGIDESVNLPSDSGQITTTMVQPPKLFGAGPGTSQSGIVNGSPGLKWGGLVFTTKGQFQDWARLHGTTVAKELALHPKAAAIYASLPAGSSVFAVGAGLTKSGKKTEPTIVGSKSSPVEVGRTTTAVSTPSSSPAQKVAVSAPSVTAGLGGSSGYTMLNPVTAPPPKAPVTTKTLPGTRFIAE